MAIASIIKYEGDNSTFVWKHPCEDFNKYSQLIVHESQEALFMMNGQALDLFGPGRYTLNTQNIPLVGSMVKVATDGEDPFHCEVYFINKTVQMALKWGTDSKVRYIDPDTGVPLELGASGSMNMQVSDSRKLLVKLVGTMQGISWSAEPVEFTKSILSSFRPMISTVVKTNLTTTIKALEFDILEVDEHLAEIGEVLHNKMRSSFEDYGLTIPEFYLSTVVLPEEDPNFRRIRELHTISLQTRTIKAESQVRQARAFAEADVTAAQRKAELERQTTQTEVAKREAERTVIGAQAEAEAAKLSGFAEAQVMQAKGYTQKDVIQAEVQKAFAEGMGNMGSGGGSGGGSTMSDIIGLGVGLQAAGAMSGQVGNIFAGFTGNQQQSAQATVKCQKCGADLPEGSKFCLQCGEKYTPSTAGETVVCPSCGKTVPQGKFCLECGYSFVKVCPNCGKDIPSGSKFCLECGTKID
ncbi:MAG: SPFH domain-containing protein [Clostridiales bacterium]|nr:SPFH domain-containing protein [Clostridiales bacterium]